MSVTLTSQTPFSIHASAYWIARRAYEQHRDQCQAGLAADDPLQHEYDSAYAPLVSAMHEAAEAAVRIPATTTLELCHKIEILLNEHLHETDRDTARELIEHIGSDAARLARIGGAA